MDGIGDFGGCEQAQVEGFVEFEEFFDEVLGVATDAAGVTVEVACVDHDGAFFGGGHCGISRCCGFLFLAGAGRLLSEWLLACGVGKGKGMWVDFGWGAFVCLGQVRTPFVEWI